MSASSQSTRSVQVLAGHAIHIDLNAHSVRDIDIDPDI